MKRFIIKRLLMALLVFVGVAFVVFTIMSLTPSSPGRLMLGQMASQAQVDALNASLGYDKPFLIRFFNWIKDVVLHFDFGNSYKSGRPVMDEILTFFPVTVRIAVYAMILTAVVGIPLGIAAAIKQNTIIDNIASTLAIIGSVMPSFWLGLLLIKFFVLQLGVLPPNGADTFAHYILPTLTVSVSGIACITRMTRSTMLETIRQDYVRTARAKGCLERTVICRHALKNALPPIIMPLGSLFAEMLGGTIITETIFVMPGLGSYLVTAINAKDMPAVMAGVTLLAVSFSLVILLTDVVMAFIDPRIKVKFEKGERE